VASGDGAAEQLAFSFYERVSCDPEVPVSPFLLARRYLGPGAIERGHFSSLATTFIVNGKRRIAVKRHVPIEYAAFYIGHELGHAFFEEIGHRPDDIEAQCDLFGAAIMAPRPAIIRLHRAFGFDLVAIADEVGSTETWAALRIGEALGRPLAAIAPSRVRVRGPDEWVWPEESVLRSWAARPPRGVVKTRLSDDPRRVVLSADENMLETA